MKVTRVQLAVPVWPLETSTHRSPSTPKSMKGAKEEERALLEKRYERILRDHSAGLRRLAASYEVQPSRREDLVQEIAMAIWQALARFRDECSERTFVFRIAHNRALSHAWKRKRAPEGADGSVEVVDPGSTPESELHRDERRDKLVTAIRSLPLIQREVITLTLEELSQAEIGDVLGITENNVAVRLNRARKSLRRLLGVGT